MGLFGVKVGLSWLSFKNLVEKTLFADPSDNIVIGETRLTDLYLLWMPYNELCRLRFDHCNNSDCLSLCSSCRVNHYLSSFISIITLFIHCCLDTTSHAPYLLIVTPERNML